MAEIPPLSPRQAQSFHDMLARAQFDRPFRARLIEQPRATLAEAGVVLPSRVELRMLDENTDTAYLVLPQPPAEGEVSDADLASASGGITPVVITIGATLFIGGSVVVTYSMASDG